MLNVFAEFVIRVFS